MKKFFTLTLTFLLSGACLLSAQVRTVSGTVFDEDSAPIIGATVVVEGTSIGVITDTKGHFTLSGVPTTAKQVKVSFVGMETQSINIQSNMTVKLKSDSQMVEQITVTTGMSKMDKRMFTGATDQLAGKNVLMDGVADVSRSLEGRAAGVSVQNVSGTFGTAPKIRVRGATSIFGNSRPLWVLDGVILEDIVAVSADQLSSGDAITLISSAVAGLNADDIESFQILKDGSATSIYGARAMAGVIVITTKKGQSGTSSVSYTGEFSTRLVPSYSEFNIMNSQEQMDVYMDMENKGFLNYADSYRAQNSGIYGKMYKMMNTYNPVTGTTALGSDPLSRRAYLQAAETRNTDWFNELFSPSIMQTHSVSISSGTDRSRNYTSMSLMDDPGWAQSSEMRRYTINNNTSIDVFKNLSLNLIGNASYRNQTAPGTSDQTTDDVYGSVKRDFDINPFSYALNSSRTLDPNDYYTRNYAPFNIKNELNNNLMDIEVAEFKMQGELRWKVIPGLDLSGLAAVKYSVSNQTHSITENSNEAMAYRAGIEDATIRDRNKWFYTDPDEINGVPQVVLPEGGMIDKRVYKMFGYDLRATVDFNRVFCRRNIVSFFGGAELSSTDRNRSYNRGYGYQFFNGQEPYYDYRIFKQGVEQSKQYYSNKDTYWRNVAFVGNGTYSWDHKYTVSGTLRYEGNNSLGRSRSARWLPTWNVSGAWNAHEEKFFEALKPTFTHMKLRASYSLAADRGPDYVTNSNVIYTSATRWANLADFREPYIYINELENSELTYEKKHELNIGLELGMVNNRINLNTDVYWRQMFDLIGPVATEGSGGQIYKYANVADMKSNGVEFTLSTKNVQTPSFQWSSDLTFSWGHVEITKLDSKPTAMQLVSGTGYAMQGYPDRSLFSFNYQGLNSEGIPTHINTEGNLTVTDINFQDMVNYDNLVYEGPSVPTITGGFNNAFSYKNFKLNVFVTYSFGNKVRLDPFFALTYSDLSAMPREFRNRWMIPGDELYTTIPTIASRLTASDNSMMIAYNAYNYSTDRIADGGFVRLKEVSLSYDFNKALISKIKLKSLQLKLQASNLFLLYADSKLNGQDPEFFSSGGVAIPIPKQFTLSVRVGF